MSRGGFNKRATVVAVSAVLLAACAPKVSQEDMARATEGYVEDTNKLFVVDCLLPGQMRKLGEQMTYLSARRPIRTTAADCEVRGGEYVAYDRANYASAFRVWLPRAQGGDAEAQNVVGQIFEKGLGQPPDNKAAFEWYKKSAEQGNSQAQLNLGHMYEKGLGTPVDPQAAARWYRKASGLESAGLQFAPALIEAPAPVVRPQPLASADDQEIESLRREAEASRMEAEKSRQEAAQLRARLLETQGRVVDQQEALRKSQDEMEEIRQKIQQERASSGKTGGDELRRLEVELRQKQEQLRNQQTRLAAMTDSLNETDRIRQEAERSRQEASELRGQLAGAQQELVTLRDAQRRTRDELEETQRKIDQEKSRPAQRDESSLQRLEQELRQKEAQLKSQESRLAEMQSSMSRERQAVKRERESLRQQQKTAAAAAPKEATQAMPAAVDQGQLAQTQTALNERINAYQKKSAELTEWLTAGVSDRNRIDQRKKELQTEAKSIAELREKVEQQNRKLAASEQGSLRPDGGPNIEIINPPVTLTRGMPRVQLSAGENIREIVGRISAPGGMGNLAINGQPHPVDASGVFRIPVNFAGGQTQLNIVATDRKNRRTDLNVSLIGETGATQAETFPASRSTAGPRPADVNFGQFYAIVIGNADYKSYPVLRTPINDAKGVELILRERYGFKTRLLINASRHAIMTALNEVNKKLTENDNLLIYYAGHGEIDKTTQKAYWLPTDAEVGNSANWISSHSITEFLGIMPARHVMVVADSCYSGELTGSAVARLPEGMEESKRAKWLKVMTSRKARTVLTSGGVEPVLDEGGGDHSIFANAFLRVLRGNKKPVLEDYELFRDVSNQVSKAAARVGFQQSPQYAPLQHAGHEGSPFFFVPEA